MQKLPECTIRIIQYLAHFVGPFYALIPHPSSLTIPHHTHHPSPSGAIPHHSSPFLTFPHHTHHPSPSLAIPHHPSSSLTIPHHRSSTLIISYHLTPQRPHPSYLNPTHSPPTIQPLSVLSLTVQGTRQFFSSCHCDVRQEIFAPPRRFLGKYFRAIALAPSQHRAT